MNQESLKAMLKAVQAGQLDIDSAINKLRQLPFETLEYASIDHHRAIRCGMPEVIYCPGKTNEQIIKIFERLAQQGGNVLATRANHDVAQQVMSLIPEVQYSQAARAIWLRQQDPQPSNGHIAVVCAGTSDIPVAEEARITAELMDQKVESIYDVGVAGLHRLLSRCEQIQSANVVVVVAGMEGALASVVGGLVAAPVIAVPTSVGYGASFGGIAPLLTMLNSCAAGVCVVNIDNGFAAGYSAAQINRLAGKCTDYAQSHMKQD